MFTKERKKVLLSLMKFLSQCCQQEKKSEVRSMERGVTRELCTAKPGSQMWWHTPGVPELEQLRQDDLMLVLHSEIMSQ